MHPGAHAGHESFWQARPIEWTANAACRQLDELHPLEEKNARECTSTAIAQASPQVENAIAAARRVAAAE